MNPVILSDPLPDEFVTALAETDLRAIDDFDGNPEDVRGIIAYAHPAIDAQVMDRFPKLVVVSNHGVGVDHIDVAAATERGIAVGNTPGCLDAATADMTMALMLAAARNVVIGDHFARGPEFLEYDPSLWIGQEVTGSTLGIVGLGRIGAEVARRARSFSMPVLYHNRNRRLDLEDALPARYCSLDELLQQSDFVALNCPLSEETTDLIDTRAFGLMKASGILINMARGPVVNTEALVKALTDRKIAAAALDVTDPEPLPRDHPLLKLDNVIITPHLGSASNATRNRMMTMTIENLTAGLQGQSLPYRVERN